MSGSSNGTGARRCFSPAGCRGSALAQPCSQAQEGCDGSASSSGTPLAAPPGRPPSRWSATSWERWRRASSAPPGSRCWPCSPSSQSSGCSREGRRPDHPPDRPRGGCRRRAPRGLVSGDDEVPAHPCGGALASAGAPPAAPPRAGVMGHFLSSPPGALVVAAAAAAVLGVVVWFLVAVAVALVALALWRLRRTYTPRGKA